MSSDAAPMYEIYRRSRHSAEFVNEDTSVGIEVCAGESPIDGAHLVIIDTLGMTGRIRILLNDGTIYDADPEEG